MANRIKGITIEIDGKTTKLQSSLKGVDSQLKKTQSSLKDVNRLLKLDPKNTELLKQKHMLLAESVEQTKEKLAKLRNAEKEAQQAFKEGKISQEQYNSLKREIIDTEQQLKGLETQLTKSKTTLADIGAGFETVGKKMMPISVTAGAIGAAAYASAKSMDEGYDIVITKTGATGKALESLTNSVDNVFSELPTTAEAAGTAIGEVNTRFGLTGEICEEVSKSFIEFAEINDTDLNSSIDNVDAIMTKFGVDTKEVGNVLGLMTKAGQDTGISMDTLESQLMTNGSTLKEMGLNLTQSVALLSQFERSGVDASTALMGLRKAQQNATKEGKGLDDALNETINSIKTAESETDALQIATELFGQKGAAEMTQAIREGRFSVDELSGSLNDYAGVVEETFNATLNPWDQAQVSANQMKVAAGQLGTTMLQVLQPVISGIAEKVKGLSEWFQGLSDNQKKTISTVLMLVTALGPLLMMISKGITVVTTINGAIGTLSAMFTATGTAGAAAGGGVALFTGPLLPAIAIIAGVTAAGILLYKNWDTIKAKATELGIKIKNVFDDIKNSITNKINSAKDAVHNAIEKIKSFFHFSWSLPKIKLPHFAIKGNFSLNPPQIPHFSVSWYRKAMNEAYLLNRASIFGSMGNRLLGGGEAGSEMVVGKSHLIDMIQQASASSNLELISAYNKGNNLIVNLLGRYLPMLVSRDITLDSGELVGAIAPKMNKAFGKMAALGKQGII